MKIGILTYHRSHNYGALLQAIALREVLVRSGHQVTFIDYWPAYHRHIYAVFSFNHMMSFVSINKKISYIKDCFLHRNIRRKRIYSFNSFISQYIEPYVSTLTERYDIIIHGSDQIWRKQPEIGTYNPVYFGQHNIPCGMRISYAASMGVLPDKEIDRELVGKLLENLKLISVREQDLLELLQSLGRMDAVRNLDPTLLLTSEDWASLFGLKDSNEPKQHYMLYYKIKSSFDERNLYQIAKSKGLELIIVDSKPGNPDTIEHIVTASPIEFLKLIYHADFIFTSSFHGLAFSLLFQKSFIASFTSNSGRAKSLLQSLGLVDQLITPQKDVSKYVKTIDYHHVNEILSNLRSDSLDSLINMLNNYE